MRVLGNIFRREMFAYFNSPIAYVFIMVFLVISTSLFLFLPPFFTFPRAEMVTLFGWLIPVLCVFIPAITMRAWAEERKENTLEMLLTFPTKPLILVLGKFLAAMAFYMVALFCTWPIPVMMFALGGPDLGPIISGYIGAVLLGSFFISFGIFISGLCKDQVIAFVLSFLACGVVSLCGWDTFSSILDGTMTGLGTNLKNLLGMTIRYLPFTHGVVEVANILYFLLWTGLFLFLNATYLEGRSRPHVKAIFSTAVLLCVVIGVVFAGLTANSTLGRMDWTEGNIYTVSQAAKDVLSELKVPVQVKVYITPAEKMPAEMKQLERGIMDKLREMQVASGGNIQPQAIHMEAANVLASEEDDAEDAVEEDKTLEERLMDKGVQPFPVQSYEQDQATTQLIYSTIGVAYKDKEEELIPAIFPQTLPDLEYRIVGAVYKLTREKTPVIAMVAPVEEMNIPPHMMQLYQQMGQMPPRTDDPYQPLEQLLRHEKYDVRRVKLDGQQPLPEEYDALVVINPRKLNSRQKWELNRAIVEGKPTLLAAQTFKWNYSVQRGTVSLEKRDEEPGVNDFLSASGLEIDASILMDANHQPLTISNPSNPLESLMGGGITLDLPMHIVVNENSMNTDVSITSRLGMLFYLWGSRINLDDEKLAENGLDVTELFSTSEQAWTIPAGRSIQQDDLDPPGETDTYPLAVLVKGQFADAHGASNMRPGWAQAPPPNPYGAPPGPPQEGEPEEAPPANPSEGKLILVGCSEMFTKSFLSRGNLDFFMNCIDTLTLGERLIEIRSKKRVDRTIGRLDPGTRTLWKFMVLGLMNIIVVTAGVSRAVLLRKARDKYRMQMEKVT